jgi:hypothetical protein
LFFEPLEAAATYLRMQAQKEKIQMKQYHTKNHSFRQEILTTTHYQKNIN